MSDPRYPAALPANLRHLIGRGSAQYFVALAASRQDPPVDTELLRTFLEVNRTRHFGRAAANLYLTQSAVSSRIRLLEQIMGVALFTRRRNDIQLTAEGRKLQKHAETILTAWSRARQEIAVEDEGWTSLNVAFVVSLAPVLLDEWLVEFRRRRPDVVLNVELLVSELITRRLGEKTLDLAVLLEAPQADGLRQRKLDEIEFVMVASEPGLTSAQALDHRYVLVNWGTWFTVQHAKSYPELPSAITRVDSGPLALHLLLTVGGSAYLARSMVTDALERGTLHEVADAPVMSRTAYAVHPSESDKRDTVDEAVALLGTG